MQKSKKQKYEQEIRKSLKTIMNLDSEMSEFLNNLPLKTQNILNRSFSKIHEMQLLRTLTLMQINFIIFGILDILEKTKAMKVQDLKIGILGGGIMGRLIINTLLVFTRQGLKTSNILVSTRQPNHLQFYTENFGINVFFDNEKIAEQAHIIFVATSATLDNWIIVDLKNHIEKTRANLYQVPESTRTSEASTVIIQNSVPISSNSASIRNSLEKQVNQSISKRVQANLVQENLTINPFIYILTSDFTYQKSRKLFNFPVYVPFFRAKNLSSFIQKFQNHFEKVQCQQFANNPDKLMKQIQGVIAKQCFDQTEKQGHEQHQSQQKPNLIQNIMKVLDFSCKQIENYWKRINNYSKLQNSVQALQIHKLYKDILHSQGSYSETFLTKSRKWRMAYNNFIA